MSENLRRHKPDIKVVGSGAAIKSFVKDGFCQNDNKVSFPIVGGKIECKNPLYNDPTCSIEDLSAVEKVFKKEGIDMDWTYDRTHLNGTLTFRW